MPLEVLQYSVIFTMPLRDSAHFAPPVMSIVLSLGKLAVALVKTYGSEAIVETCQTEKKDV